MQECWPQLKMWLQAGGLFHLQNKKVITTLKRVWAACVRGGGCLRKSGFSRLFLVLNLPEILNAFKTTAWSPWRTNQCNDLHFVYIHMSHPSVFFTWKNRNRSLGHKYNTACLVVKVVRTSDYSSLPHLSGECYFINPYCQLENSPHPVGRPGEVSCLL